jgi:hypothetical protein
MIGYDQIPEYWKQGLDRVEDLDFKYTTISLNDVYDMGYRHALEMVIGNGGKEGEQEVTIPLEQPRAVKYEKAFEGHYPTMIIPVGSGNSEFRAGGVTDYTFGFSGKGFVIGGRASKLPGNSQENELMVDVTIDGEITEHVTLPTSNQARRNEIAWKYNLEDGDHKVKIHWKNPMKGYKIDVNRVIIYGSEPVTGNP